MNAPTRAPTGVLIPPTVARPNTVSDSTKNPKVAIEKVPSRYARSAPARPAYAADSANPISRYFVGLTPADAAARSLSRAMRSARPVRVRPNAAVAANVAPTISTTTSPKT